MTPIETLRDALGVVLETWRADPRLGELVALGEATTRYRSSIRRAAMLGFDPDEVRARHLPPIEAGMAREWSRTIIPCAQAAGDAIAALDRGAAPWSVDDDRRIRVRRLAVDADRFWSWWITDWWRGMREAIEADPLSPVRVPDPVGCVEEWRRLAAAAGEFRDELDAILAERAVGAVEPPQVAEREAEGEEEEDKPLSPLQRKILDYLLGSPLSKQLAIRLGTGAGERKVREALQGLEELGLVSRPEGNSSGYSITDLGRLALQVGASRRAGAPTIAPTIPA